MNSVCSCGLRTSKVSYKDPWTEVAVHIGRDHAGVLEKLEANLYKLRDHYKSENGQKTQRSAQNNVVSTIVDEVRTQYNRRSMSRESSVEILSTTDEVPIQTGSRRSSVTSVDTSLKRRLSSSNAIQLTKRIRPSDDKVRGRKIIRHLTETVSPRYTSFQYPSFHFYVATKLLPKF